MLANVVPQLENGSLFERLEKLVRQVPDAKTWGAVEVAHDARGAHVTNIRGDGDHMFLGVHVTRPSVIARLPADVTIEVANDNSAFIDRSVKNVYSTITEAIVLVALASLPSFAVFVALNFVWGLGAGITMMLLCQSMNRRGATDAANLLLVLAALHLLGVAFETRRSGRQIVSAMIGGKGKSKET